MKLVSTMNTLIGSYILLTRIYKPELTQIYKHKFKGKRYPCADCIIMSIVLARVFTPIFNIQKWGINPP